MPRYSFRFDEATIGDLQARMESGRLSSRALVRAYLRRIDTIDRAGPGRLGLRSVLEVNPDAERIAATLDEERRHEGPRGPLHGIPVLVKDNMDSADRLHTSAGSLALTGSRPKRDATVVERLRNAGAVILGKTNLSEWSNIRSPHSSSGWSGRGGQTRNPYALDRSPSGSSSGSAAAVAANLATAALGTETDGSILCPAAACCVVGIKPTVGLTSRAGVIPIAHSQDTVGPICRTVADAATVLGALVGVDPRDPATRDSEGKFHTSYRRFLDAGALPGARIGIPREVYYGYSPPANQIAEEAIEALRAQARPRRVPGGSGRSQDPQPRRRDRLQPGPRRPGAPALRAGVPAGRAGEGPAHRARLPGGAGKQPPALAPGHRQTAGGPAPRRPAGAHQRPAVDHRPGQRRPRAGGGLDPGGAGRLPGRDRAGRLRRRAAGRRDLLRHRLERAHPDPAGVRVRAGHQGPTPAAFPPWGVGPQGPVMSLEAHQNEPDRSLSRRLP